MNQNLRNTLSLFTMDLGLKFIGFLATVYLARILGKSGFGAVNVGQSVLSYALILANSGLALLGTRNIAANEKEIVGEIFYGRLVLSIIVFALTVIITFILSGLTENFFIVLSYLLYLFPTIVMLDWFFTGIQKMETVAFTRIIGSVVYLLLIILIVNGREDTVLTGIAFTAGGIVSAILFVFFFKQTGSHFHLEKGRRNLFKTLKKSVPLGMASYISQFLTAFPVIYIAFMSGNEEAGIFSAAIKMIGLFLIFDRVFVTLFLPKITNVISTREKSLEELFNVILKIIVFSVLIVSVLLFIFSHEIITKAFGPDYVDAILMFKVLLVYFIFTIIDSVFANTLIGLMKEKVYTMSLLTALIIFLLLTFILTPSLNEYGVIFSFILINVISLIYMIIFLRKEIKINLGRYIIFPLIISSVFYLVCVLFSLHLYIQLIIALFLYTPVLIITTGFGKNEIEFIKRIFI